MHELSVTESILKIALTHAELNHAAKVTDVYLVIGQLSSIVDDSVQFYWDFVSQDTMCAGSRLHFSRKKAMLKCLDCGQEFPIIEELGLCPSCGSHQVKIVTGEEFFIDSIEIEKAAEKVL